MTIISPVVSTLKKNGPFFHPVVPFLTGEDRLQVMDYTAGNKELTPSIYADTTAFDSYVEQQLQNSNSRYGIGGYNELREIYAASTHFGGAEPRRLHLGVDIWGPTGTPVFAFLGGRVHSFAFNNRAGDYGATLILLHQLEGVAFHTLYGHISIKDIENLSESQYVVRGQEIAHFGDASENGHWPPHLHFQIIVDMQLNKGDYPGVCRFSEREKYLENCPDPDLILQMNRYTDHQPA